MKKEKKNRNWVRILLGGFSMTSALFVFQACYGSPQDFEPMTYDEIEALQYSDSQQEAEVEEISNQEK